MREAFFALWFEMPSLLRLAVLASVDVTSAKLAEALRDNIGVRQTRLRALPRERMNGDGKAPPERIRLDRANVGIIEPRKDVSGRVVIAARLDGG